MRPRGSLVETLKQALMFGLVASARGHGLEPDSAGPASSRGPRASGKWPAVGAPEPTLSSTGGLPVRAERALSEAHRWATHASFNLRSHHIPAPAISVFAHDQVPPGSILGNLSSVPNGMWVAKQEGHLLIREEASVPGRNPSLINLLREMHHRFPNLGDFAPVFFCTHGYKEICMAGAPGGRVPGSDVLAIHVLASRPENEDGQRLHLVPDNTFDHWAPVGIYDFDDVCQHMRLSGDSPARQQKAGWLGNIDTNPIRKTLVEISAAHLDLIEAVDSGGWRATGGSGEQLTTERAAFKSMPELVSEYAYLIDVEGIWSSFRLKYLLYSQRPVLMQERRYIEYWYEMMEPWVHFIPVSADLSDLVEQVEWLQSHPHEAEVVARNALHFAERHLTRAAAVDKFAHVFDALGDG